MNRTLLRCSGGRLVLPDARLTLVDAADGGNLVVDPPREVWERGELTAEELVRWSYLVAAAGRAMLETLPQLDGGCVNYWEAGNWALHQDAAPVGPKTGPLHRRVHLHLLGRSRTAASPDWTWGEAPRFPRFAERHAWAARHRALDPAACDGVVRRAARILRQRYAMPAGAITPSAPCAMCAYPTPATGAGAPRCEVCRG